MDTFFQITLDGLDAHVAVLDAEGTILHVNRAWREFARQNGLGDGEAAVGANYFQVCGLDSPLVSRMREVFAGTRETFRHEYPCHSSTEKRWFQMRVRRVDTPQGPCLIVSHENVTEVHESFRGQFSASTAGA